MRICIDCGAPLTHRAAKRCPACRVVHQKAYIAAYRKKWARENRERCNEVARAYYHRNIEARRAHTRNYRAEHREALNAKAREYYWSNRDAQILRVMDYQRRRKLAQQAATNPAAWVVANLPQLRTCPRLHVTALHLPCGQREECHLHPVCEQAQGKAAPRNANWGWTGGDGGSLERVPRKRAAA